MTGSRAQTQEASRLREIKRRLDAQLGAVESGLSVVVTSWVNTAVVASVLHVSMQAANNHLKRLLDVDLVERRAVTDPTGGRMFEYRKTGEWL